MSKLLRGIGLILAGAVALTGCVKIDADLVLHPDDTIDGTMVMAVQKGLGESTGMSDEDLLGQLNPDEITSNLEGATVAPYEDQDWVGQVVTFEGQPIADVSPDDAGVGVTRDGDFFVVQGDPLAEADEETGGSEMLVGAEATMSVTFPGEVVETNGTVEGTTVTWDMFAMTEPMYAKGKATAGFTVPDWAWYIAGCVLLLIAMSIMLAVLISHRRDRATAEPALAQGTTAPPAQFEAQPYQSQSAPQTFEPAPQQTGWEPPRQGS